MRAYKEGHKILQTPAQMRICKSKQTLFQRPKVNNSCPKLVSSKNINYNTSKGFIHDNWSKLKTRTNQGIWLPEERERKKLKLKGRSYEPACIEETHYCDSAKRETLRIKLKDAWCSSGMRNFYHKAYQQTISVVHTLIMK